MEFDSFAAGQRGTLFWHAHISWLRSSLYGPILILPKLGTPYPFAKPYKEVPIIFGEWFNSDPEAIINQAMQTGAGPNVSDAYTINGLPGPLYNCSAKDTFKLKVKPGKAYLLRMINAALNDELFFSIANHTLTVVEVDAIYVKPFDTDTLLITPGQTTNVLLKTKPHHPNANFFMSARPYVTGQGPFDNSTVAGILEYEDKLRSLASAEFPANLPQEVDRQFFFTVGLGTNPCSKNNLSGTKWNKGTSILGAESHPLHLHGFNFFVVGQGFGNFDPRKDSKNFNLVDPVERNTVGVPSGGWVAIRFLADNPEAHTSWGLKMAWVVLDGKLPNQKLLPPPADLPKC
ncbi:unnamed protein product [Dovyalis caffra]|uniref:laccase n=1 Tax=Dovyalis caffra TaxID=77055 RepID=A0AAV1R1M6_9ROSI|nr:unnamed protein product [Dovyalis caffra]